MKIPPLLLSIDERFHSLVQTRAFVCTDYDIYYCRIPKAANSTTSLTLAAHIGGVDIVNDPGGDQIKQKYNRFDVIATLSRHQILRTMRCFTVVRNPYDRVLSAYLSKVRNTAYIRATHPASYQWLTQLSFCDFLYACRDGLLYADGHWTPQYAFVPFAPNELHDIARVESLQYDLARITTQIFGRFDGLTTKQRSRTWASRARTNFYGACEYRLVQQIYLEDFRLFYPDLL